MYTTQQFLSEFPRNIVVAAWIKNKTVELISPNKAHLVHLLNSDYSPVLLLDEPGRDIAQEFYGQSLIFREFHAFVHPAPKEFSFRIRYKISEPEVMKSILVDPELESYMLGAFYSTCPPLMSLQQTEPLFKLGAKYNLSWEIFGLPEEARRELDVEGSRIAETAVIGYLANTQKEFSYPGLNGTFYWTADGLSVNVRGINPRLKSAAATAMQNDLDLKRTGYADVLSKLFFSGQMRTGELIPLYPLKQERREKELRA